MASTTFTVITPTLLGTVITEKTGVASGETITIDPSTAQGALDTATLFIKITATSAGAITPTIKAGTTYSSIGQGDKTLTKISSSTSAIIGGQAFESARFVNSSGNIVIQMAGTGVASIEAYQAPQSSE